MRKKKPFRRSCKKENTHFFTMLFINSNAVFGERLVLEKKVQNLNNFF